MSWSLEVLSGLMTFLEDKFWNQLSSLEVIFTVDEGWVGVMKVTLMGMKIGFGSTDWG